MDFIVSLWVMSVISTSVNYGVYWIINISIMNIIHIKGY